MEPINPFSAISSKLTQSLNTAIHGQKPTLNSQVSVKVSFANNTNGILIQNQQLNFLFAEQTAKPKFEAALSFMLNTYQSKTTKAAHNTKKHELLAVGLSVDKDLPREVLSLAKSNHVSLSQLTTLAKQPSGYLLPELRVSQHEIQFSGSHPIKLSKSLNVPDGQYLTKIKFDNGLLKFQLTPILVKSEIMISSSSESAVNLNASNQATATSNSEQIKSLIEPAKLLNQLFNRLDKMPLNIDTPSQLDAQVSKPNIPDKGGQPLSATVNEQSTHFKPDISQRGDTYQTPLHKALMKTGAVPKVELQHNEPKQSLAATLLSALPQLSPVPLASLASAGQLKLVLEKLSGAQLSDNLFSPLPLHSSLPQTNMDAVTLLFQLLLGLRIHSGSTKVSEHLLNYMKQLQSQSQLTERQLMQLQQAGVTDSLAHVAKGFQLYQQTNADNPNHWFFALPFMLNQSSEQLEGHFEQSSLNSDQADSEKWQLQLKFNLQQSGLLIKATKQADSLTLIFQSENQQLLNRIDLFSPSLSNKLSDVGFSVGKISSQQAKVPATLLPGDHYLLQASV